VLDRRCAKSSPVPSKSTRVCLLPRAGEVGRFGARDGEAATAGLGFALLPRYLIEQELTAGTLRIVLDRPMQTENSYYLAIPEGKLENPISRAFREWITEQVGDRSQ